MYDTLRTYALHLNILRNICHKMAVEKGWWDTPISTLIDELKIYNDLEDEFVMADVQVDEVELLETLTVTKKASSIALMHSELSECLEAIRKDLPSDHLTGRSMEEEELADVIIRIMDYCGRYNIDIGEVMIEKIAFNAGRSRRHGGKKL